MNKKIGLVAGSLLMSCSSLIAVDSYQSQSSSSSDSSYRQNARMGEDNQSHTQENMHKSSSQTTSSNANRQNARVGQNQYNSQDNMYNSPASRQDEQELVMEQSTMRSGQTYRPQNGEGQGITVEFKRSGSSNYDDDNNDDGRDNRGSTNRNQRYRDQDDDDNYDGRGRNYGGNRGYYHDDDNYPYRRYPHYVERRYYAPPQGYRYYEGPHRNGYYRGGDGYREDQGYYDRRSQSSQVGCRFWLC